MNNGKIQIVLINPEIPQNTGNVGRTCVGLDIPLHLVGKLGFNLSDKEIRRAGLDYWSKLDVTLHESWELFQSAIPQQKYFYFFSTHGKKNLWDIEFKEPAYLIFGSESQGFPREFYFDYEKDLIRIPVSDKIRSLNLATAVGVAAFEASRQFAAVI